MELKAEQLFEGLARLAPARRRGLVRAFLDSFPPEESALAEGMPFLVPLCLEAEQVRTALRRTEVLLRALLRLEEHVLTPGGEALRERLVRSLEPGSARLVAQCTHESAYSMRRRLRRVDAFLEPTTGGYSVLEVNQVAPLSFCSNDLGQRLAERVLGELGLSYTPKRLAPRILRWLRGELHARHPGREPRLIALVSEHGYPAKSELPGLARLCQEAAREAGHDVDVVHCYPPEVRLARGRPTWRGREVDILWRQSVFLDCYRERGEDVSDYEAICSHPEEHLIVNSTRSFLTASKETFALLCDAGVRRTLGLPEEDMAVLRETLPDTVDLAHTPHRREDVLADRAGWISKPTDSSFGQGVEFGTRHTAESWARLVEARSVEGFLFQRRIPGPELPWMEVTRSGELVRRNITFDFCPHQVDGELTGTALIRAHPRQEGLQGDRVMNVAGGGCTIPFLAP
jgi:hypothetical protein